MMKSIFLWIISLGYFAMVLYFYKNNIFLSDFYEKFFSVIKIRSLAKIVFTTLVILIPEGFILYLFNHKWKKWFWIDLNWKVFYYFVVASRKAGCETKWSNGVRKTRNQGKRDLPLDREPPKKEEVINKVIGGIEEWKP